MFVGIGGLGLVGRGRSRIRTKYLLRRCEKGGRLRFFAALGTGYMRVVWCRVWDGRGGVELGGNFMVIYSSNNSLYTQVGNKQFYYDKIGLTKN